MLSGIYGSYRLGEKLKTTDELNLYKATVIVYNSNRALQNGQSKITRAGEEVILKMLRTSTLNPNEIDAVLALKFKQDPEIYDVFYNVQEFIRYKCFVTHQFQNDLLQLKDQLGQKYEKKAIAQMGINLTY